MSKSQGVLYHRCPTVDGLMGWYSTESSNPPDCKYEGEIENGLPNGSGTYTKTDGATYVGHFKDGLREGQGTFTWPDDAPVDAGKFIGEYKDNRRWNGTIYDKEGNIVYNYVNGEME